MSTGKAEFYDREPLTCMGALAFYGRNPHCLQRGVVSSEMVTVREKYMSDFLVGPYCGNMIAINSVDISSGLCMVAINTDNGRKNMAMQISQLEPFGDGFEFPIYSSNLLDSFLGE